MPIDVSVVTNQSNSTTTPIVLRKPPKKIATHTTAEKPRIAPILKMHSFEQAPPPFRIPEALHLPAMHPPTGHKAMFTENKIKKIFNIAYADSGTDIHITNPSTVAQLGLHLHPYAKPVTIQFGDGSLQCATHFVFMGDILDEVAVIATAPATLISIYSITTKGLTVEFSNKRIKIVDDFTNKTLYRNRVITPGHYTIDIEKFMKITTPQDFKHYKQVSKRAAATYETVNDGYTSHPYDTDTSQDTPDPPLDPCTHTCHGHNHHAFSSTADIIESDTLADIIPTKRRKRDPRLTSAQTKKILWLHKCMGHPGRDALADFVDSAQNIDSDITRSAVHKVFNHLHCTACELSKRNKADKTFGSGVTSPQPGATITVDYQGTISPTSARGHTGFFIAKCTASTYIHTKVTKSKDSAHYIEFLKDVIAFYRHHGHTVINIRTDSGSTDTSEDVRVFLRDQTPPIYIKEAPVRVQNQNPVEREVQTMIKAIGAILTDQYTLGATSWDYALAFWTKTHNSIPNSLTDKQSPHEIVTSQQPDASHFRFPFGCPVTATNVMGRDGDTYDIINEFGIAIGSNDSGNGATKIIIPGRPTKPYFERLHVEALKFSASSPSPEECLQYSPTYNEDDKSVQFHTPPVEAFPHPYEAPIPHSTLGNSIFDMPTTLEEATNTFAVDTSDTDTTPSPPPISSPSQADPLISRRVRKVFKDHGTFEGTVAYKDNKHWYTVIYDDGDSEDCTRQQLADILIDDSGNTNPTPSLPPRQSPRLRQTYMAEIVTDPIAQDGQPHPDNTTNFHNYVRHSFNRRMSYAAKKIRTQNNPTITQAKRSISWQQWKIAILSEFKNLLDKNTYTIIERKNIPAGANIIHTKMDLKIKYDSLGEFIKHKARLVILGNLEPEDGRNDYAATANHKATGLLLAIAAKYNMELTGCDIEGAFLTALIDEPIYIALPRGLSDDDDKPTYARLNKSMYGLRRSPQLFQNELYHHLRMHGYT